MGRSSTGADAIGLHLLGGYGPAVVPMHALVQRGRLIPRCFRTVNGCTRSRWPLDRRAMRNAPPPRAQPGAAGAWNDHVRDDLRCCVPAVTTCAPAQRPCLTTGRRAADASAARIPTRRSVHRGRSTHDTPESASGRALRTVLARPEGLQSRGSGAGPSRSSCPSPQTTARGACRRCCRSGGRYQVQRRGDRRCGRLLVGRADLHTALSRRL
jgi:hypothetical protein